MDPAYRRSQSEAGAKPAVPTTRNEAPARRPDRIYSNRVEHVRVRRTEWRAVATRDQKTASGFTGVLCLAAARGRIRSRLALIE